METLAPTEGPCEQLGDVLDCGSHGGIKLIVMKVLERLVEKKVKSKGTLDSTVCSLDLLLERGQQTPYSS